MDSLDLRDVEQALFWVSLHPHEIDEWTRRRDAAIRAVYVDGPQTDLIDGLSSVGDGPEFASNALYFTRLTLCALWLEREAADNIVRGDLQAAVEGAQYLHDWYDVDAAVTSWRSGRREQADVQAGREARRGFRELRSADDLRRPQ